MHFIKTETEFVKKSDDVLVLMRIFFDMIIIYEKNTEDLRKHADIVVYILT